MIKKLKRLLNLLKVMKFIKIEKISRSQHDIAKMRGRKIGSGTYKFHNSIYIGDE